MLEKMIEYLKSKPLILLIEDDVADSNLIKQASKLAGCNNDFLEIENVQSALRYLNREGEYINSNLPDIIILDLYLPSEGGIDFLKEIKSHSNLRNIPVIVFTKSDNPEDIKQCYNNYANSYITKPSDFDKLVNVIGGISNFWLNIIQKPVV